MAWWIPLLDYNNIFDCEHMWHKKGYEETEKIHDFL